MTYKYAPYSATKLKDFDTCPLLFRYKHVDRVKIPFVPKAFFEKGNFFHWALEHYPKAPAKPFKFNLSTDEDIEEYGNILKSVLRTEVKTILTTYEDQTRELKFKMADASGQLTLFTGRIDFIAESKETCLIIDWKTGKNWNLGKDDQVKLYALWAFKHNQDLEYAECSYYYIEQNEQVSYIFKRDKDFKVLEEYFTDKINTIENERKFEYTPHRFCHNCDYLEMCNKENNQ